MESQTKEYTIIHKGRESTYSTGKKPEETFSSPSSQYPKSHSLHSLPTVAPEAPHVPLCPLRPRDAATEEEKEL